MKGINSKSYEQVLSLGDSIKDLSVDKSFPVYNNPYEEAPLETYEDIDTSKLNMYIPEDIAFVNTSEFSKTSQYFEKHGVYTKADPKYDKREYKQFWDREEKRRKEGITLPGKLKMREDGTFAMQKVHITGEHYGYLNFSQIKASKEFKETNGALTSPYGEKITKGRGKSKDHEFPSFWDGDYYFFKAVELCRYLGKHLVVGKARRKGYSYKNGWIAANRADLYPATKTVVGAYDLDSLTDDGTMNKVKHFLDHINKYTDWNKRRLNNTLEKIRIGYRFKGDPVDRGFLSEILTAVFRGNPGAVRGKDADLIFIEEAGKCPNLDEILTPTLKTLSDGIYTTGLMIVFGTGGGDDKQWEGFEDLFYNTYKHKFITFSNIWDDDLEGTGCGFFHSALMNKPGLIDEHGNSNIKEAHQFEEEERALLGKGSSKATKHAMEEPYKPSEAFSRVADGIMPSEYLDAQYRRVKSSPFIKGLARDGIFVNNSKGISFIDKRLAPPSMKDKIHDFVTDYPLKKETDVHGCWRLWEQPYRNKTGKIPDGLYRVWNDPFGIDKTKKHFSIKDSLGTVYIYEVANNFTPTKGDRIIGAFHGRREQGSDFNIQMFLAAQYYNAKILYENDRGSVYVDAKTHKVLDLLEDEPTFEYQKSLTKGGLGRKKGISIAGNSQRKKNGAIFLKDWLLTKRGIDENGNSLLNLHYYYDEGGLKELIKYDGIKNADRASCLIVGMYDVKEMQYKQEAPDTTPPVVDDYLKELGSTNDLYNREQVIDNYFEEL